MDYNNKTDPKNNSFNSPLQFIKQFINSPASIGAIAPSGPKLCLTMAKLAKRSLAEFSQAQSPYIVELGSGTGVVTKALLAQKITSNQIISIENNQEFAKKLQKQFPNIKVINAGAEDLQKHLTTNNINLVSTIISSLPLLSLPEKLRTKIVAEIIATLPSGGDLIQFTYGLRPPYYDCAESLKVISKKFIAFNLPPAFVWHYKKI